MDFISIKPAEFEALLKELQEIKNEIANSKKKTALSDLYLDNQDLCLQLKISKRLLQSWRDEGKIPFIQHQAKIWYRASDVLAFLESNYNKKFSKK